MSKHTHKIILFIIFFTLVLSSWLRAEIIDKINITGNERISKETIKMFSGVSIQDDLSESDLNGILKKLYNTNFFDLVSVKIKNKVLIIEVKENPIVQNINYEGIKSSEILKNLKKDVLLKSRSSFTEVLLDKDKKKIKKFLKDLGYYFSSVDISIEELKDNKINLTYNISLGEKAKIKKISFIGEKIFKDKKLKGVILSEEYKPWKFLSGKKYLNESMIKYDERLLKNFYLNKGYYNVEINSSFAKLTTIEVTTEGTGTTKQLAILDGLKNAITQVNGAVLGASTAVSISEVSSSQDQNSSYESSQAFQQNIKSATKGVVQGFDILSLTQNPDLGNLFVIEMNVKVAKYKKSKDLAYGISWCLNNNNKYNLGKQARKNIVSKFSNKVISSKYIKLYKEVTKK